MSRTLALKNISKLDTDDTSSYRLEWLWPNSPSQPNHDSVQIRQYEIGYGAIAAAAI